VWPARSKASTSALLARKCGYASRGRVSEINFHHSARRSSFEGVRVLTKGLSVLETQSILKRANYFLTPSFFLNPLGASSSSSDASSSRNPQSDPRRCRAMQRNAEESRAIQSNPRDCRNPQRRTEQSKRLQRCTDSSRRFPRRYRECSYGKVEFCLPTKLHAPSLADRVIGRMGHTLNAFGLFAREAQETLEARRSDSGRSRFPYG